MIELRTKRLLLRRWRDSDREPFAALNQDPWVMEFFPSTLSREASDASINTWQSQFAAQGWSNWAAELAETGQFTGYVGLTVPRRILPCSPCVEIGWRLAREFWGLGLASEAANEVLRAGFERIGLAEIVSFTAVGNKRSRAVMERIGMRNADADFEYPGVPEGHPLRNHCLYRITPAHRPSRETACVQALGGSATQHRHQGSCSQASSTRPAGPQAVPECRTSSTTGR